METFIDDLKLCRVCSKYKTYSEFYTDNSKTNQLSTRCKACQKQYNRSEHHKLLDRACYQRNKTVIRERKQKQQYRWTYGLEYCDFLTMQDLQDNKCYICNLPPAKTNSKNQVLYVDHDHATGKIRKLLCNKCNFVLGLINEDPELLKKMIKYIEEHYEDNLAE